MAKKKVAYRKKKQNKFSMVLVTTVVLMILIVVYVKSIDLKAKIGDYSVRESQLQEEIEDEKARAEEIEEYRKYTETKGYVEEVAKDKLGLVYEGEIIFKEKD